MTAHVRTKRESENTTTAAHIQAFAGFGRTREVSCIESHNAVLEPRNSDKRKPSRAEYAMRIPKMACQEAVCRLIDPNQKCNTYWAVCIAGISY